MKKLIFMLTCLLVLSLGSSVLALAPDQLQGYLEKQKTWEYIRFGSYPTDADDTVRPVLWRVLQAKDGKAYLLSEYILFAHRVDPNCYPVNKKTSPYAGWETSELFNYLNREFLTDAFTESEKAALAVQADGGLVSLLDAQDLTNKKYGFISRKLYQAQSTAYAKAHGLYVYQGAKKYSPYWLRTRSKSKDYAQRKVQDNGDVGYISVEVSDVGVRPAIMLDLSCITDLQGSGTADDPFIPVLSASGGTAEEPALEKNSEEGVYETEQAAEQPAAADQQPDDTAETEEQAEPEQSGEPADTGVRFASEHADLFPPLTDEGFLPEGEAEFVLEDEDAGIWLYASPDLRIEIVRKESLQSKNRPWRWFEADIFVRPGSGDFLKAYYHENDPKTKKTVEISKIAQENHLVFSMNSDWYYYRVQRNAKKKVMPVGIILRQGTVMYDDPAKKLWTTIPNRDILALYPDGSMEVYDYNGATASELQMKGACDVLSFGPVLLRDGEVTAQTLDISARQKDNPRSGIGLVCPGHYVSIVMEGRRSRISVGCSVKEFAELFRAKGCTMAYNLDGGGTATMMFMGRYINQMGDFTADARKQTEVLGIGISEQVQ